MRGYQGPRLGKKAMQKRNAKIVKLRDEYGLTFKQIAERFGMSDIGVRAVYNKVKEVNNVRDKG